ncbi:hypothetical protein HPB52_016919 [Rhipicephalus sanguineus]|uniref:IRS-type PTB domain-containing protein n=1 Tax=Rhipicephalus sanguineus TaxID=34632 RepID=A0A9D4YQI8_RHISA|nr:hypothetical protein HPB52_016919 [Rhipicephalus sanguineus]
MKFGTHFFNRNLRRNLSGSNNRCRNVVYQHCIHVQLYRDSKERCKQGPTKASLSLAGCLGLESGFTLDKESHTMALICPDLVLALAFDSRELLIQWQVKIRSNVAEVQQFLVQIWHAPGRAKLASGPARLHLQDHLFCMTSGVPPRLLGSWPLKELRRFGLVDGKFCFEGGSKCGKGEGLHVLHTNQAEELAEAFEAASRGKLAARRKLPCKASATETPSRMSLQPRSRAQESSQCSSSESRRPLLSSGCSDVGSCDACFEIVRFASDAPTPDDFFRSRTFCKVHYRWPSCVSQGGPAPSVSSSDAESADTVSLTISDIQEPLGTKEAADNQVSSPLPVSGSAPAVWTYTHCGKCGRHYCARCSFPSQSGRSPDSSRWFAPQWTADPKTHQQQAWTTGAAVHGRSPGIADSGSRPASGVASQVSGGRGGKPSDRASLCSQSSGTSSASTSGASTSSSEYNVPRSFLESLYDQPRSIIHTDGELFREQSKSAADITPDLPSSDANMDAMVHYDVPKKYKEHVSQQESSQGTRAARLPLACSCGNSLVPDPLSMCQELNACSYVRAACTCNRVTFWAGNLVPCFQRAPSEESQAATLQCPKSFAPSTICREPGKRNRMLGTMPDSKKHDHCSDYVNCHFIESLPLYQNTCALSSVSEQCDSDKDAKSATEKKTIISGSPSVNNNQFKSPEKSATLKKTAPRASTSSNTIGESYEMMSFRGSSEQVSVVCDSNYIAMRPIEPCKCDNERGGSNVTSSDTKRTPLPLRPFMPYLLPCEEEFPEDVSSEAETSWKNSTKCSLASSRQRSTETPDKPSPLADAKRKVLTKKRSSSADGRQETEEMSEAEETVPIGRERRPTFSKLPFRARSQNLVDVTPPSSVPSTPNNRSMENLYRIPFHRSADCLKLKGDFRFSEEDLSMDAGNADSCDAPTNGTSIKRSSSVPCKPQQQDTISSPSDSGVSTSLPESSETVCELATHECHLSSHPSLPRNLDEGTTVSHRRCDENKRFIQEAFARCPQQGSFGLPGERYAAALKGSSESSTTSSDSDYIETLSLCSSGSNGSGSEYLRCEDIAAGRPCPVSCGLKPRSAKEYNAIDRSAIRHEMHEEGVCGAVLHTCHQRTHHHAPIHLTLPKAARSAPPPSPVQGARASAAKPSPAAS